jgi:hypothetical protein
VIRPLHRVGPGHWESRDGRWTFLRHWSDPRPHRWFAYLVDDSTSPPDLTHFERGDHADQPQNDGLGHVTLAEVADWAELQGDTRENLGTEP